jgi:dienelactone hydrolase
MPGRRPVGRGPTSGIAAVLVGLAAAAALASACGSDTGAQAATTASTPAYGETGPDTVGVTTLDLGSAGPKFGERLATVFYPAGLTRSQARSVPKFSYTEAQTLPAGYAAVLPARYDTTTTIDAYGGVAGSKAGPFPIVLFSHGYGGERLYYSNLLAGIASWGYVVVSADYLERGLAAQVLGTTTTPTPALDSSIMMTSLAAVEQASSDPSTVLHGTADPSRVAAVGHSAGGQTAFDALDSPKVDTAIGWAPEGPAGSPSHKPVMIIRATGDSVIPTAQIDREYEAFPGPRALVQVGGEGHNTYTDICVGIRSGGGLIGYAVANHLIKPQLAELGINGCQKSDPAPQRFWPIAQYYTVFQLKARLGHGPTTVPEPSPGAFPGLQVRVAQQG